MFEIEEIGDMLYIIMEYCSGGNLLDVINCKYYIIYEIFVANIFREVVEAVCQCHRKRVIHRDIKPENFLYFNTTNTTIKLIDFGLSIVQ